MIPSERKQNTPHCEGTVSRRCKATVCRHKCEHNRTGETSPGSSHRRKEKHRAVRQRQSEDMNLGSQPTGTSQPHAAYAAFVHGLSRRWTFLSRTIPGISNLLQPLENAIHQVFIPSLTGRPPCSNLTRNLLSLPVRLGGLGLVNPTTTSDLNFQASEKVTAPLVAIISSQDQTQEVDDAEINTVKKDLRASNHQRSEEEANIIYSQLTPQMKRQVDLAKERGASSWLSVLPLSDQGFHLH